MLNDTKVYRGGATLARIPFQTEQVRFSCTSREMRLSFRIPAAGGGTTSIVVVIGAGDLDQILLEVACFGMQPAGGGPASAMFARMAELAAKREARVDAEAAPVLSLVSSDR